MFVEFEQYFVRPEHFYSAVSIQALENVYAFSSRIMPAYIMHMGRKLDVIRVDISKNS